MCIMKETGFLPLTDYCEYPEEEMKRRSTAFYEEMKRRRTIRHFSNRAVPREIIEDCLRTAATAPSGANMQPWQFVVVSEPSVKKQIREAAETVERKFYQQQAARTWGKALEPLGTDAQKPFLEIAPYLIVIFARPYDVSPDGEKIPHYYVTQSVGIATGMLIAAVHHAGLVSLTYTPANMDFLNQILVRPAHEKPFLILVAGYPAEDTVVPVLGKKSLEEIAAFI